jgi:hypothetical protein
VAIYSHPWRLMVLLRDRLGATVPCRGWSARNKDETRDRSRQNDVDNLLQPEWPPSHRRDAQRGKIQYAVLCRQYPNSFLSAIDSSNKGKLVIHADYFRCHVAKVVLDSVSQGKLRFASPP